MQPYPSKPSRKLLLHSRYEPSHPYQVVDRQREGKHPPDPYDPSMASLSHQAHRLQPPEDLLHPLALSLADLVSGVSGGAVVQGTALFLRHVRGHLHRAQFPYKVSHVEVLVGSQGHPMIAFNLITHHYGRFSFRRPPRLAQQALHHQTVSVFHQHMPQIAELGLLPLGFLIEPGLGVGGGLVRIVAPLLAPKLNARITPRVPKASRLILFLKALLPCPGFDQGPVHREVLVGQKPLLLGLSTDRFKELLCDVPSQKPLPVLGKHRGIPDALVHVEPHKPPKKQIVIELLHQKPLASHCVERLQQKRPQKLLRRYRWPSHPRIKLLKLTRQHVQRLVGHRPNRPQRMALRHPLLRRNVAEHTALLSIFSTHQSISPRISICVNVS